MMTRQNMSPTQKLIWLKRLKGGGTPSVEKTVSGALVHITDALAKNAKSVIAEINPVQSGSGDPAPDNIRPITGWTGANVTRTGKNLFEISNTTPATVSQVTYTPNDDGTVSASGTSNGWNAYTLGTVHLKAGSYKLSSGLSNASSGNGSFCILRDSGNNSVASNRYSDPAPFTVTEGTYTVVVMTAPSRVSNLVKPGIYLDDTAFIKGESDTYSISFVDGNDDPVTVYGGTLDVTTGVLTVTDANIASYNGETLPSTWISDRDVYASGTTPTTGAQVVYKLATSITYNLTPQVIAMLLGENNLWHDCNGDIEVTYLASSS